MAPFEPTSEGPEDLLGDGSVVKTVLVEGAGEPAGRGAKVAVKYALRLSEDRNAEPFDSSAARPDGVLEFTLGRKKVIPALEVAGQSMKVGEKCRVTVAPAAAFGKRGLKRKGVPPDATVYMEVEMIRFEGGEKKKTMAEMSPGERFEEAKVCKEAGNTFFKELKYEKAMSQYSQCIRYLANVFYKPNVKPSKPDAKETDDTSTNASEKQSEKGGEGVENAEKEARPAEVDEGEADREANEEGFEEAAVTETEVEQESSAGGAVEAEEEVTETIDATKTGDSRDEVPVAGVSNEETNGTPNEDGVGEKAEQEEAKESEPQETAEEAVENDDPQEAEVRALHVTTLNNLSLCLVKMEDYKRAVESASLALRLDPESSKAFYYRGRAQVALGEWDKAREDLVAAAKIQPNNVGIRMEITKLDKKRKDFETREKKQAAAMFA